jgi:hypothetical protein
VTVQYISWKSGTTPPETPKADENQWGTAMPDWKDGEDIWSRTVIKYSDSTKNTISSPVKVSAAAAKSVVITGPQIFKKSKNASAFVP